MTANGSNSPAWLFSFVDLAFLLLIAMTQLAAEPGPVFGEIVIPRIRAEATEELPVNAPARWQLRVHPPGDGGAPPFEFVLTGGDLPAGTELAHEVTQADLLAELQELRTKRAKKPLLAPHGDARSQDLLDAVAALEQLWPSRRRVTVARIFEER